MAGFKKQFIGFSSHRIEVRFEGADPPGKGTFVLCHPYPPYGGDMDNKVVIKAAEVLLKKNFSVLRYNMRGVGASTGSMAVPSQDRDDLARLLSWLAKRGEPEPFYLAGYSYGAHISLSLLCKPEAPALNDGLAAVKGIITIACPFNLPEFCITSLPGVPIEIIQGTHDDLVPAEDVETSLLPWELAKSVRWIAGADHCFNGKLDALQKTFSSCVEQLSSKAGE